MEILLWLIPISLILLGLAAIMLIWAVNHKQFDNLDARALDLFEIDNEKDKGSNPCDR